MSVFGAPQLCHVSICIVRSYHLEHGSMASTSHKVDYSYFYSSQDYQATYFQISIGNHYQSHYQRKENVYEALGCVHPSGTKLSLIISR